MMDHLTTTLHQFRELLALDNVDSPSDGAEVMVHPAVRDLVIDVAVPVGVLRYRILEQATQDARDYSGFVRWNEGMKTWEWFHPISPAEAYEAVTWTWGHR